MQKIIFTVLCLTAGLWAARGDLIVDPYKSVRHVVRLQNLRDFSNHVFYIHMATPRGYRKIAPFQVTEEGVTINTNLPGGVVVRDLELFAVPKALVGPPPNVPDEAWFTHYTNSSSGILRCELPVAPVLMLSTSDPANVIEDVFRIKISGDKLGLSTVVTKRHASITGVQKALFLTSAPAMFILFRRTRSRSSV